MTQLNAAQVGNVTLLQNYYMQAYATVRKYSSCIIALCPPESQGDGSAFQFFMAGAPYTKVIQDVHKCASAVVRSCGQSLSQWPHRMASTAVAWPHVAAQACQFRLKELPT